MESSHSSTMFFCFLYSVAFGVLDVLRIWCVRHLLRVRLCRMPHSILLQKLFMFLFLMDLVKVSQLKIDCANFSQMFFSSVPFKWYELAVLFFLPIPNCMTAYPYFFSFSVLHPNSFQPIQSIHPCEHFDPSLPFQSPVYLFNPEFIAVS